MEYEYKIKNEKLKRMLEKKADEIGITVNQLIYNYINRGLLSDGLGEEVFLRLHSQEHLKEIDEALGLG